MFNKNYYIYIMSNERNTVLYTGITSNLEKRVYEHKNKLIEGFTARYNLTKLVYHEITNDVETAIAREKKIKAGSRKKKIELIESENKEWRDLSKD